MGDDTERGTGSGAPEPHSGVVRPDAFGEPRPPAAPRRSGTSYRHPTRVVHLDPHHPPPRWCIGPEGRPPLEAVEVPRWACLRDAALDALWVVVLTVVAAVIGLIWGHLELSDAVWIPLAVGVLTVGWRWRAHKSDFPPPVVAGADWLGSARRGAPCVRLYELTRIAAVPACDYENESVAGATDLNLWSGSGPGVGVELELLQTNPALWDLVYQGITASIAAGAEVSEEGRQTLRRL